MFLKNKKTNSKIRFQQSDFRQRLQSARGYKRQGVKNPGLTHLRPKIIIGLVVIGVLYLVYIPNFLYIKNINVSGISNDGQQQIIDLTGQYLKAKPLSAQSNWLFFSQNSLAGYLLQNDADIVSVTKIKKTFPRTVTVSVTPRITAFNVTTPLQRLLISNDGLVRQDITALGTSTSVQEAGLVAITVDSASSTAEVGTKFFSDDLAAGLTLLSNLSQSKLGTTADHFEITDPGHSTIWQFTSAGYKLIFTLGPDLAQNLDQAQLLLNSLSASQKSALNYVDMRFEEKSFICYKNTACAQ